MMYRNPPALRYTLRSDKPGVILFERAWRHVAPSYMLHLRLRRIVRDYKAYGHASMQWFIVAS